MKMKMMLAGGLMVFTPFAAMAAGVGNSVDAYYVSSGIEVDVPGFGSADDDGDGFGVKGKFAFADQAFIAAEYQAVEYDNAGDLDQIRAGVGMNSDASQQAVFYGLAEFINLDDGSEDESGFGLHAGGKYKINDMASLNARLGYVDIGDAGDGFEWLIGGAFKFTEQVAAFVDYRVTYLEKSNVDTDLDDLRVGVRFMF